VEEGKLLHHTHFCASGFNSSYFAGNIMIIKTLEVGSLSLFKQRIKVDFPLPDKPIILTFNFKANIVD
jgi:hypothetical protein